MQLDAARPSSPGFAIAADTSRLRLKSLVYLRWPLTFNVGSSDAERVLFTAAPLRVRTRSVTAAPPALSNNAVTTSRTTSLTQPADAPRHCWRCPHSTVHATVRPSVCLSRQSTAAETCGGFAAELGAGSRYLWIAARAAYRLLIDRHLSPSSHFAATTPHAGRVSLILTYLFQLAFVHY